MQLVWLITVLHATHTKGCISFGFLQSFFIPPLSVIDWPDPGNDKNASGPVTYNPTHQKCCNGHVSEDINLNCCGTSTYDPKLQVCCDGNPSSRINGSKCCGKNVFNPSTALCCSGKIHPLDGDKLSLAKCCIREYYLPDIQVCCEHKGIGTVQEITETLGLYCCGSQLYDKTTQVCCSDKTKQEQYVVPAQRNNTSCCGGVTYDWSVNRCCSSTIVDRWQQCCGDGDYNHRTEACCVSEDNPYPKVRKIAITKREEGCCNGQQYNKMTHKCCGNKQPYDKKTQLCCRGQVFTHPPAGKLQCCNDKAFDTNEAKCLRYGSETSLVMLQDPQVPIPNDKCVPSTVINEKTELCCRTSVGPVVAQKQSEDANRCCGKTAFSQSKGICCEVNGEYHFTPNTNTNSRCCGAELYNLQTELCCGDNVVAKLNSTSECCRNSSYNSESELCCRGIVVPKRDKNEVCCYDIQTDN